MPLRAALDRPETRIAPIRQPDEQIVIDPALRYRAFVDALEAAKQSIDLSIFRCDDPLIVDVLASARARGVRIRTLLTNRAKGGRKQLARLEAALERGGVDVARYRGPCSKYHAKYALIDGRQTLVSSMNLTRECFEDTDDVLFTSGDASIYRALAAMFEADWQGEETPLVSCDRLIVSPDNARERMTGLIASARRSIVIVDHKLGDPKVLDLLLAAQARGVSVHLVTDRKRLGVRAHGKTMVIDGRRAVVGSLALSSGTLNRRRDVAVLVDDPGLIREVTANLPPLCPRRSAAVLAEASLVA